MSVFDTNKWFEQWHHLLAAQQDTALVAALQEAPVPDIADFLAEQSRDVLVRVFLLLDTKEQALVFGELPEAKQFALYHALPHRAFAELFVHVASDLRADFYQKLDDKQQAKLLPYLPKKVRRDVIILSAYPTGQAGSIMSTDFVTLGHDMTAQEALNQVREEAPSEKMLYNLYVVDEERKLLGLVSLKNLVMLKPDSKIVEVLEDNFVVAKVNEDKESVARKIEKYDLVALPILNDEQQLVGIVSYDDAMEVMSEEQTEDMERFMGIVPDEHAEDYLDTPARQHFNKRIRWIAVLFVFSTLSELVLHSYETLYKANNIMNRFALLALYIPMITGAGGNIGSQTATVIIRALSLGQLDYKEWLVVLFKEVKVALLSVACLFGLAFGKVYLLSLLFSGHTTDTLPGQGIVFALVISTALSLQVFASTLIGAALPLLSHWLGKDPALVASPAITTIVDATGVFIYFTVARLLWG